MKRLLLFLSMVTFVFLVGCSTSDSKEESKESKNEETTTETKTDSKIETETKTDTSSNSETTAPSTDEEFAQAFSDYLDEMMLLAVEEERIIGLYDSVTGVNYTNDEVLYYTLLDEVIPGYRQFVADLEAIMPENKEIQALHEKYIEAANIQYNSFTLMISAIEQQSMDTMTEANQGLDEARRLLREWLYQVDEFSIKAGIPLE
ncbi:hypothetical protein [Lysinibacillus halotolerans]|uniref:Uncharacterized protein n=1 Tax=Lysinibacillus halotolerans TaxID=1368476 RepID=A0A3M8H561_9BACI|nr:hypothetical protein [Lysinibacillus halotolerans]RNC97552.1 hypothetical protein EC501_14745 [Lysinibacillus halotolerans]